jgi:hypothetical protein
MRKRSPACRPTSWCATLPTHFWAEHRPSAASRGGLGYGRGTQSVPVTTSVNAPVARFSFPVKVREPVTWRYARVPCTVVEDETK